MKNNFLIIFVLVMEYSFDAANLKWTALEVKNDTPTCYFSGRKPETDYMAGGLRMKNMNLSVIDHTRNAEQLEKEGQLKEAAKLYEAAIKPKPVDEHPYNRLMIIYRKLKLPKDELRVIKQGIAVFETQYNKKSRNKKLTELSNKIMRSAGLADKKGNAIFHPEPVNKWMKRKELLEKKMKN
jgi:hypothetical protein